MSCCKNQLRNRHYQMKNKKNNKKYWIEIKINFYLKNNFIKQLINNYIRKKRLLKMTNKK